MKAIKLLKRLFLKLSRAGIIPYTTCRISQWFGNMLPGLGLPTVFTVGEAVTASQALSNLVRNHTKDQEILSAIQALTKSDAPRMLEITEEIKKKSRESKLSFTELAGDYYIKASNTKTGNKCKL